MVWICWTCKSQLRWDFPIRFHFFGGSMFNSGVNNMFLLNKKSNFKKKQLVNLTCSHQSPTSHTFMPFCFFPTSVSQRRKTALEDADGSTSVLAKFTNSLLLGWLRNRAFFFGPPGWGKFDMRSKLVGGFKHFLFSIIYGIIMGYMG